MIVIIDNYDSFTHNLAHALPAESVVHRNDAISRDEIAKLNPAGIVLSPGPGHPKNDRDFGVCKALIERPLDVPMLGVCLGMQGMAYHTGGEVESAPEIVHGEARTVELGNHAIFEGIARPTSIGRYHSLAVTHATDDWELLGKCEGTWMAIAHRERPWVGVQFHPESILTPDGPRMMANFARMCA